MSLSSFFAPVDLHKLSQKQDIYASNMAENMTINSGVFPDLNNQTYDIALIGVLDDRHSVHNKGAASAPDAFRRKFYQLNAGQHRTNMVDLGNIKAGNKVSDTYVALKLVLVELITKNITPLIIGGGQDLTYAQYMAYEDLEQKVDLVVVDSHFDMGENEEGTIETTSASYLNKIFIHEPNYLFNFSNIGYQSCFVSQDQLRVMDKLYFDVHRLGAFSGKINLVEPVIRNANMVSFDLSAIRSSDACGNANASPNGFYGDEACQICRYAGMNDKLSSIGFYEYNPSLDAHEQTAMLLAQMVWYFIDGFYSRKNDIPLQPKSQYVTYRTNLKDGSQELVFVKSKKTDRWWMQVPYPKGTSQNERFHLVPCLYEDYQTAVSGEMPDLWWRTYQKLS